MDELVLPKNISVGMYDSRLAAKGKEVTANRVTLSFEIELPTEQGGISYINHENFHITPDTVICVKPGQQRHTKLPFKCYFLHMEIEVEKGKIMKLIGKIDRVDMLEHNGENYVRVVDYKSSSKD